MKKDTVVEAGKDEPSIVIEYDLACERCGKYEHKFQRIALDQKCRVLAHTYNGDIQIPIGEVSCDRCQAPMVVDQITVGLER